MAKCLVFLFVLCLGQSAFAQVRFAGKVVDSTTGKPVPYVSVLVPATSLGTTSNADGEFELLVPDQAQQVVFKELGYTSDTVRLRSKQPLLVKLKPAVVSLPEVQVPNYLEALLLRAYRVLLRENATHTYGQAFYRQITRLDGEVTEVQEQVWNAETSSAGVSGTQLVQGRYAEKKALLHFRNFSNYTKAISFTPDPDSIAAKSLIGPNTSRYYTLKLLGVEQMGPQQLVEISFASKAGVNPNHYTGSLVVDAVTGQTLRLRLNTPDFNMTSNNPTFKFKDGMVSLEYVLQYGGRGPVLTYIKTGYTATVGRLFKPDLSLQVATFAFFYDGQSMAPAGVVYQKPTANQADLDALKKAPYDAAFWQNYSVVKRTPLEDNIIKNFEKEKGFGTMLLQQ